MYEIKIVIKYGELTNLVNWCKKNCTKNWNWKENDYMKDTNLAYYTFLFETEKDYFAFKLWKVND